MAASDSTPPLKFCKKCNAETTRYKSGKCKPCANASHASYAARNKEKIAEYKAEWRLPQVDRLRAKARENYRLNADRHKEKVSEWISANREKNNLYKKKWKTENKDKIKVDSIAWNNNRRARKLNAGGRLSRGLAERLYKLQKGKCACCGLPLGNDYHLDHIMPLALGGANTDNNIQLLHSECNQQKHAKHPVDFMQSRGFLL